MRLPGTRYMSGIPALVLLLGVLGNGVVQPERSMSLKAPLAQFPVQVAGYARTNSETLSTAELRILSPDDYLLRTYRNGRGVDLTLFVAYYGKQLGGSSIHSPRNCLPGSGWEPIRHERVSAQTLYGEGQVNRYLVEHKSGARALVYYWYQGRGRVTANEYAVKWELLRDGFLHGRSDEALVRLVFPLYGSDESLLFAEAGRVVHEVSRLLGAFLPS